MMATEEAEYEVPSITVSQIHDVSVKAGFLWKTSNIAGRTVSKSQYFVLTKSSLDQYKSRLCDRLKGRVLLAAIENVEVIEKDGLFRAMRITCSSKHPLELTAPSKDECDEWVSAIRHGTRQWRLDSEDIDDGTLNLDVCDGIPQPNAELLDVPDITHMKRPSLTPSDISFGDAVVFTGAVYD